MILTGVVAAEARGHDFPWTLFVGSQWNYSGRLFLSLSYVALRMLLIERGVFRRARAALSATGRMAFTN